MLAFAGGACRPGGPPRGSIHLFVSPSGNDTWSGTRPDRNAGGTDGPFATLTRARDELRRRRATAPGSAPAIVFLRGGTHRLAETFRLDRDDSGTAAAPVHYRSYEGEKATLCGDTPPPDTLVEFGPGAAHVILEALRLERCAGTAVTLRDTERCLVSACTIRDAGGAALSIEGGIDNGAIGNDIHEVGAGAIELGGGDLVMLVPSNNRADDNYIHHTGRSDTTAAALTLAGCGNRAAHNLIHDCPAAGIELAGTNLVVEFNAIRHVALRTPDTGAIRASGRDWIGARGSVIRHNLIRDVGAPDPATGDAPPSLACGIDLDEHASGIDVVGNIVARAPRALIRLHNGSNNLVDNNILVDGTCHQIECAGWTASDPRWTALLPAMTRMQNAIASQPAWRQMRNDDVRPQELVLPDGTLMSRNRFRRNVVSWCNPAAGLFALSNFSLQHNRSEQNLFWHHGLPLRTGRRVIKTVAGANLAPNPGFDEAGPDDLPARWEWQSHPPNASAAREHDVTRASRYSLRLEAAALPGGGPATGRGPSLASTTIAARPGQAYRLAVRLRAASPATRLSMGAQSAGPGLPPWTPHHTVAVGPQWQTVEFIFQLPGPGEPGHHPRRAGFQIRLELAQPTGTVWLDHVDLREATLLNEWESWRALGMDARSVIADPLFADPERDDYRLQPESPAFGIGFDPIPAERIGPRPHPTRASWPVVEAAGASERRAAPAPGAGPRD